MTAVLDTSAAVEIVLQRGKAGILSEAVADADRVLTPTLFVAEITNVFWKYYRLGELPQEVCEEGLQQAMLLPDEFVRDEELFQEAFALGCQMKRPVYDMFFIILTRRTNGHLLTMDRSLKNLAGKLGLQVDITDVER